MKEESKLTPLKTIALNTSNERDYITVVKAFALISIVCAHIGSVPKDSNLFNKLSGLILESIGSIGVGVFLLISGFLFFHNIKPLTSFFKSRIKTIFIPWIFCGTLCFLYVSLRKGGGDFSNYFLFLTQNSFLYYLSVLILSYILFWRLKTKTWFLLLMIIISIISITLTGLELLKLQPYTNPFNWSIYFSIGLLIKKYCLLQKVINICEKWLIIIAASYVCILIIYLIYGTYVSYWKYASIVVELIAIALILGLSVLFVNSKKTRLLLKIGEMSFALYLLHMPFAGIITNLFNHYNLWFLTFFRPIIVIWITIIGIEIATVSFRKIGREELLNVLLGLHRYMK